MDYLLKSSVCMIAFYGLYFFGFRQLSFHSLNRFYLLASLAFSLTIPLINYEHEEVVFIDSTPIQELTSSEENLLQNIENQSIEEHIPVTETQQKPIDWLSVLSYIYFCGMAIMLLVLLKNIFVIVRILVKNRTENTNIFYTNSRFANASFFNYIFLNPDNLNPHEQSLIIAHEHLHGKQLHSLDMLFLSILKAIFWFNPVIYFYQKSLKQIHEYEVDALMSATHDSRDYAHLLLKLGVAPNAMIINQFSTKPLSDRIQFLFKTPTKNMKKLLYFLAIPIIGVGIMAFAEEKVKVVYKEKYIEKSVSEPVIENKISSEKVSEKKTLGDTLRMGKITKIDSTRFTHLLSVPTALPSNCQIYGDDILLVAGENYIKRDYRFYLDKKYSKLKVEYSMNDMFFVLSLGKSTPSNLILYPELVKLDKVEFQNIRFPSRTPVFSAKNGNKVLSQIIKLPSFFSKVARNQDTLRTILETNKLGKNPLVFINGEEYPSSILYRLNPDKFMGSTFSPKNNESTIKKYGEKARDGLIKMDTREGDNDFLLKTEKERQIAIENVKKQLVISNNRVRRVILKDFEGKEYEKVSVMRLDDNSVHFSVDVPVGGKVLFTINGKIVSEEEVNKSTQHFTSGGCGGMGKERNIKIDESSPKYYAYIDLGF
jgi:hypothetical protein